jgi:hypothetical protein
MNKIEENYFFKLCIINVVIRIMPVFGSIHLPKIRHLLISYNGHISIMCMKMYKNYRRVTSCKSRPQTSVVFSANPSV